MAKGLEDTVFYIYNRLAALNEVGGEPQQFGLASRSFTSATLSGSAIGRRRCSPLRRTTRNAAKTCARGWWRSPKSRSSGGVRCSAGGTAIAAGNGWSNDLEAPDANEEYLLYQTLLGTWPMQANGEPEPVPAPDYIERIQAYMAKALKEAKMNTSWIQPNEEWDAAMHDFVARILDSSPRNKFLPIFLPVAKEIARLGAINSLAQILLKLTRPGVPDIYQGTRFGISVWSIRITGGRSITNCAAKC